MNEIASVAPRVPAVPSNGSLPAAVPDAVMTTILALAADPAMDPVKLKMLVEMQREQVAIDRANKLEDEQREAARAYTIAMNAVQAEMPPVVRDAVNPETHSRYAKLESIVKVLQPIYAKHGFSLSFNQAEPNEKDEVRIECEVSHIAGHSKIYHLQSRIDNVGIKGSVNKTQIHGMASSFTYLRRYLTTLIFNIVTPGDDDDGNATGRQQQAQAQSTTRQRRTDPLPKLSPWITGVIARLEATSTEWEWLQAVLGSLAIAPDVAEVNALLTLEGVSETVRTAPQQVKNKIAAARQDAITRLNVATRPGHTSATTQASAAPFSELPRGTRACAIAGFEAVLIDQHGEPLDHIFQHPADFARALVSLWNATEGNVALIEHNADAIEDARASAAATAILAELDQQTPSPADVRQNVGQESPPVVQRIEPPVVDQKSHWPSYKNAVVDFLPTVGASIFDAWIEAQKAVLKVCPMAQRVIVIRAIAARAAAINTTPPRWLGELSVGNKIKPDAAQAGPQETDDERAATNLLLDLETIQTTAAFQTFAATQTVQTLMARLRRTKPPLFERADAAFGEKLHQLNAGAHQ